MKLPILPCTLILPLLLLLACSGIEPIPGTQELLRTRTSKPQPSPALIQALDLDVPYWHKPGAAVYPVKIGDDVGRLSTEAALAALLALKPTAVETDYDRSWIAYQTGSALQALGREAEARTMFEHALSRPRTNIQDRQILAGLYRLGDERHPGWCMTGRLQPTTIAGSAAAPPYPEIAKRAAVEGWVTLVFDVQADGAISRALVESSSMRVFEQAAIDWLTSLRYEPTGGTAPGRPCFVRQTAVFKLNSSYKQLSMDQTDKDEDFSFRSIGVARQIRGEAREKILKSTPRTLEQVQASFKAISTDVLKLYTQSGNWRTGQLEINLTISADGSVADCHVSRSTMGEPLQKAIVEYVKSMNFGISSTELYTVSRYPINFHPR